MPDHKRYFVSFSLDVKAETPQEAAEKVWDLLGGRPLPVASVTSHDGEQERVDLEACEERGK